MRLRGHLAVFLLFVGLVAVYTWPLARDPGHLLPGFVDPRVFAWTLITVFRNLVSDPALLFHGNAFYPLGNSLALGEVLLVPALLAGAVFSLSGNPVLAYNLTLIPFWALSGWAMYAVTFRLTRRHPAAFLAAVIFTFAPYRMDHYGEFQMEMAFGIPLAVYLLVRFLEDQRPRHLVALLAVFWLQAVSVWYYAIILSLGLLAIAVQYAALRWAGWRPRALALVAVGAVALAIALAPVALPYFQTRRELGYTRGLADAVGRSADVLTYVEARANWLYRAFTVARHSESSLFLGIGGLALAASGLAWLGPPAASRSRAERALVPAIGACLVLALVTLLLRGRLRFGPVPVALSFTAVGAVLLGATLARHLAEGWRRWRAGVRDRGLSERDWVVILLGLAAFAFLLSLGPIVELAGQPLGWGLYAWLWPYLFPLQAIRGPTRIGVLYLFAGALLAGFGVKWLGDHWSPWKRVTLVGGLGLLTLAEYAWMPLPYQSIPSVARPVDEVLRREAALSVVLEFPTNVQDSDGDAMLRSLAHGKRIVNGFSGFVPDSIGQISGLLSTRGSPFPVPEAQAALRQIYPLRYLVVRLGDPMLDRAWRLVWKGVRETAPPLLRFRGSFGNDDLYEILPVPERGMSLERWVSYDVLRAHPVLRLAVRPLSVRNDLEQWAEVRLNGRPVERLRLDVAAPPAARLALSPPFLVAAPNVIGIDYRYTRPPGARDERYRIGTTGRMSPGDLRVLSAGQPQESAGSVELNGIERSPDRRGYNLVALDEQGQVREAVTFDTFFEADAADRLAAWVAGLPAGTIVAGAVRDEGSGRLTEAAVRALGTLGVRGDLRGRFREAHAFVGVKGAAPGTALEGLGPRRIELAVGRIELGGGRPAPAVGLELTEFTLEPAAGADGAR